MTIRPSQARWWSDHTAANKKVFNRGFGPSTRVSMRKFSDARQEGQVAQIQLDTAEKRQQAATKNADVIATDYNQFVKQGISKDQAPQLICLGDAGSKQRSCIPLPRWALSRLHRTNNA